MYSYDSSFHARFNSFIPDVVAIPRSTAEISEIMRFASNNNVPVVPRGAGSGETCGCLAVRGGVVLDLSGWDTIEEVDANMVFVSRGCPLQAMNTWPVTPFPA